MRLNRVRILNPWWWIRRTLKDSICHGGLLEKLGLCDLIGMIEYCKRCGRRQPLVWHATDDLWMRVTGDPGTCFCPECFGWLAERRGVPLLMWRPEIDPAVQA